MADPEGEGPANVSNPIKRIRWATQRVSGASGQKKRHSIMDRFHHKRSSTGEKKRDSAETPPLDGIQEEEGAEESTVDGDHEAARRRIFFNNPLPDDAKDEDGHPIVQFGRNKIRTAKYTPLSFIPKNLYYQFHNIANIYFFIIIILDVSAPSYLTVGRCLHTHRFVHRFLQYSALPTLVLTRFR